LFFTQIDYLKHSARISKMARVKNERITTKLGIKEDILQEK
jgi:hypothetical protein